MRWVGLLLLCTSAMAQVVVNEVTQLYPIQVPRVETPKTIEEIAAIVKASTGPISVGGGRFSMGGQTALSGATQIDMRQSNEVIRFDAQKKEITVQAGITWRKIQEYLDPHQLSVQIMQSYSNFTVGGALSVNAHGRYIGLGPAVLSVVSVRLVLADGSIVTASPTENSELFYGAIGGYGGIGIIAEATLKLADNVRVERQSTVMKLSEYGEYFRQNVRDRKDVIFHNADIYPDAFDQVRATSYVETQKPVTVSDRLVPKDRDYGFLHFIHQVVSEWPGGKLLRQYIAEPWVNREPLVVWRNYEASYDVKELEPDSRAKSTYVLQEFFVPVGQLNPFATKMANILRSSGANTINISIRHAHPDPGTLLAWARQEDFAFVLYYKQGTSPAERRKVSRWTRELMDAAIEHGGAYYLPYQIWGTDEQFHQAYPRAGEYFALKAKVDPTFKFRNSLWDAYYRPAGFPLLKPASDLKARIAEFPNYKRDEAQTYLTVPEWYLVFNPTEYATYIGKSAPSGYPYFASIGQFWSTYNEIRKITAERYSFNLGYHVMVAVIGTSFTVENTLKGLYEWTVGRVSEWTAGGERTAEDQFGAMIAKDYVDFLHVKPWYEYPFLTQVLRLWREVPLGGAAPLRKIERRLVLSLEYLAKAQYGMLIRIASRLAYGEEDSEMLAVVENSTEAEKKERKMFVLDRFADATLISLPRYDEFGEAVRRMAAQGVKFREIAGNREIFLTAIAPNDWQPGSTPGRIVLTQPILTDPGKKRVGIVLPVGALHELLPAMQQNRLEFEHLYDY